MLCITDIPKCEGVTTATFVQNTALLATSNNIKIQHYLLDQELMNIIKCNAIYAYQFHRQKDLPIIIDFKIVPYANTTKYLGNICAGSLEDNLSYIYKTNPYYKIILKPVWMVRNYGDAQRNPISLS